MRAEPKRLSRLSTVDEMVGKSLHMFWFRLIGEMFSAVSAIFLFGGAVLAEVMGLNPIQALSKFEIKAWNIAHNATTYPGLFRALRP